jgi:hypothetical protein
VSKKNLGFIVLTALLIVFTLAFYKYKEKKNMTNILPQNITLHFGYQGVRDFHTYTKGENDNYPNIMSFSDIRFQPPNLGTVNIEHAGKTLVLRNIFSVMGTKLGDRTDGIGALDIYGGLNKEEFVTSEQAYQGYVALMQELNSKGWQLYYNPWDARYVAQDNLKIILGQTQGVLLQGSTYISDASKVLNFKEWQTIFTQRKSMGAKLYLRDLILELNIDQTPDSKPRQEQYLIRYTIDSVKYSFYSGLNEEQRKLNQQELKKIYDENMVTELEMRNEEELKAKQAGFHIDENYKDPDMWQYIVEPSY